MYLYLGLYFDYLKKVNAVTSVHVTKLENIFYVIQKHPHFLAVFVLHAGYIAMRYMKRLGCPLDETALCSC